MDTTSRQCTNLPVSEHYAFRYLTYKICGVRNWLISPSNKFQVLMSWRSVTFVKELYSGLLTCKLMYNCTLHEIFLNLSDKFFMAERRFQNGPFICLTLPPSALKERDSIEQNNRTFPLWMDESFNPHVLHGCLFIRVCHRNNSKRHERFITRYYSFITFN